MSTHLDLFTEKVLPLLEMSAPEYLDAARAIAREIAVQKGSVTIDDVRLRLPPPESVDARVMGAVLAPREFTCIGYEKSSRRECHNRPIGIFTWSVKT